MIIVTLVSLFSSRVVLNALGVIDYGVFNVISGVAVMFTFFSASLSNATQRYLNVSLANKDINETKKNFNSSFVLYLFFSLILLVLGETIGLWFVNNKLVIPEGRMLAANVIYQITILSLIISLISAAFQAEIVAHEDMKVFAFISLVDAILKLLIAYAIYVAPSYDRLVLYGLLLLLANCVHPLLFFRYSRKNYAEFKFELNIHKDRIKEQLSLIGWNAWLGASIVINQGGVNIILNIFFGVIVNAARGITGQINGVIHGFMNNILIAVRPQITQSYAKGDMLGFNRLINDSTRYCFYMLLILSVPFLYYVEPILKLWLGQYPEHTIAFTRLLLLYSLIDVFSRPLWIGILATGNIKKYAIWCSIIELSTLLFGYFILLLFDIPEMIYIVMIVVKFIFIIIAIILFKKQIPDFNITVYIKKVLFPILFVTAITMILTYMYFRITIDNNNILDTLFNTIVLCIITFICIFSSGLNQIEKKYFLNKVKLFFGILKH